MRHLVQQDQGAPGELLERGGRQGALGATLAGLVSFNAHTLLGGVFDEVPGTDGHLAYGAVVLGLRVGDGPAPCRA